MLPRGGSLLGLVWPDAPLSARPARTGGSPAETSAVHDEPTVDAESLTRHVFRARRHQKPDHIGDVLRTLHPPQRDLVESAAGELFRRLVEQCPLLTGYRRPHVRLDKPGAYAVQPDAVG